MNISIHKTEEPKNLSSLKKKIFLLMSDKRGSEGSEKLMASRGVTN